MVGAGLRAGPAQAADVAIAELVNWASAMAAGGGGSQVESEPADTLDRERRAAGGMRW